MLLAVHDGAAGRATPDGVGRALVLRLDDLAPVLCGDRVLVGANDGVLYTLEAASGQCVGRDAFASPITAAPALLADGLCVATWDGQLYRFSW